MKLIGLLPCLPFTLYYLHFSENLLSSQVILSLYFFLPLYQVEVAADVLESLPFELKLKTARATFTLASSKLTIPFHSDMASVKHV